MFICYQNSEYKILPDEREYGDDFIKKSIKINPRNQKFINDISKALSTEKDLKNIIVQIEPVPYYHTQRSILMRGDILKR